MSCALLHFPVHLPILCSENVVIDACILESDSGLLQQACDITGGMYLKIPQPAGLLQYLLWVNLPDPVSREKLNLSPRVQVNYRAACFCHRNIIDIGYVCSVCLSSMCSSALTARTFLLD
ncbi:general transcription factor IIH subunit 3-like [Dreissena polymorpha]|uniref:general transcription factor IIH subunit 3-like n=1 Tax=Dreissena polymorpha TaxID=45954 RepID=UPI002263B1DA|nr:general transcription factor IIH subunit 3-like [Dreissena polymorpha]